MSTKAVSAIWRTRHLSANSKIVTRSIVGLKKEESEALLAFLYNHIGRGVDWQARVRWAPKMVVAWDVSSRYWPFRVD